MAKYGSIFSYWSKDWECDLMQAIRNAAKSDLNFLEFHVHRTMDWSDSKIQDVVALAKDLDIELFGNGGVDETCITYSDDPAVRQRGIDRVVSCLKQAKRFGCTYFDGGYSEAWPVQRPENLTADMKKMYTDRVIASIKEMVKVAEDLGITMCMEIVNRFEAFLVNTAEEAKYVADQVNHPNFKITVDTYHANIEEDSIDGGLDILGDYVGHVHMGESNRRLPGQGAQIDWDRFFGGLKRINYKGRLMVEPFTKAFGTVGNNVFLWRDLSNGADEEQLIKEMKESIAFVKSKFED